MRHADEGTLHELIDGSLPPAERERVEHHVERCADCRGRLQEARELVRATASLVEALDVPLAVTVGALPPPPRPRWNPAALGWAASILVAVGIGFGVRAFLPPAPTLRAPAPTPSIVAPGPMAGRQKNAPAEAPARSRDAQTPVAPARGMNAPAVSSNADSSPATAKISTPAPTPTPSPTSAPPALRMHPAAAVALEAAPTDTNHRITLEEAVAQLGGSIRLIDGLQLVEVERTPGARVLGADPRREAVLVRYRDPRLGMVELAQQRILAVDTLDAEQEVTGAARRTTVRFAPQPQSVPDPKGAASLSWSDAQGFHMVLTAAIPPESLVALRARVK